MPAGLLRADGPGGHPDQRRVPVLRRVGSCLSGSLTDGADYQHHVVLGLTIGDQLRDHPSVLSFQLERQHTRSASRSPCRWPGSRQSGFYGPDHLLGRVQPSPILGPRARRRGLRLGAAQLLVRHHALRATTTRPVTNVGGAWGFDSEQSAGDTVPTMDSIQRFLSAADQAAPVAAAPTRTSTTSTTSRPTVHDRLLVRHPRTISTPRSSTGTGPGPAWPSTSRRPRSRTTRTPGPSSRRSSTTGTTPRRRPPAPSTGSSTRAGRRCSGTCTTSTATRPAATSAPRRPTRTCTCSTPLTPAGHRRQPERHHPVRALGRIKGV